VSDRIDELAVARAYEDWFTRGIRGFAMRFLFSRRGLFLLNTPYRRILEAAHITVEDRVLDFGCGIGNILIALAERTPFSQPAVGTDIAPGLIEMGKREVARAGLSTRIELQVAPATRLPFQSGRFDVVLTSHVIKHLDDAALASAFAEVARVLTPGGRFLLWEFDRSPFSAPLFWSAAVSGLPPPFRLRNSKQLAEALTAAGFHRVRRLPTGFFLVPPVPRLALLAER
jgi:ubiquinone/menaquinone biosynthesis C-methylase UbiE